MYEPFHLTSQTLLHGAPTVIGELIAQQLGQQHNSRVQTMTGERTRPDSCITVAVMPEDSGDWRSFDETGSTTVAAERYDRYREGTETRGIAGGIGCGLDTNPVGYWHAGHAIGCLWCFGGWSVLP